MYILDSGKFRTISLQVSYFRKLNPKSVKKHIIRGLTHLLSLIRGKWKKILQRRGFY